MAPVLPAVRLATRRPGGLSRNFSATSSDPETLAQRVAADIDVSSAHSCPGNGRWGRSPGNWPGGSLACPVACPGVPGAVARWKLSAAKAEHVDIIRYHISQSPLPLVGVCDQDPP